MRIRRTRQLRRLSAAIPQTFSHKRPRRTIMVELILSIIIDILFS